MNGSYWPVASFDWPTALSGWTTSQVASWLHSLPVPRQQMLHMHLPTSTSDTVMEFAVLGHTAAYLLGRSGALMQIERWAPASRYHLVTTSNKQARLTAEQLPSGALPLARTSVHSTEALSPWATNLHGNLTRRASGPGAIPCWKLFAPFVPTLAAVPRLIFLDSDLLLLESPQPLWAHFDAFSPRHLIGLALNHDGMTGLNSGVLLLHLERMRADGKWARMLHAASAKLERQPPKVRLGWLADQTFLSFLAAWQFETNSLYPPHSAPLGDRLYSVPCGWNRQLSVHAANQPNFWPNWASCTEPCRFAHFSGVFFKNAFSQLQAVHNLSAGGCAGIVQEYLAKAENLADPNRRRMLTYMRDGCCPRLPDS